MRAGGRGGRQGPRGDRIPPRALLRLWGVYAHGPPSALGGLLRAGSFCVRGRRFLRAGPFLVQGAHAPSAALCIDKVRRRNAICGRRWNAKREAAERRASWQAANLRFAAMGGCVSPCFIVVHIAVRLPLIHPVSMEYLLLSGSAD